MASPFMRRGWPIFYTQPWDKHMSTAAVSVLDYLPLVRSIAEKLCRKAPVFVEFEDMVSEGVTGLLHACSTYKEGHNAAFGTFAYTRIRGAMIDSIRRRPESHRVLVKQTGQIEAAKATLRQRLFREPESDEIAEELGWSLQTLYAAQLYEMRNRERRLDALDDEDDNPKLVLEDKTSIPQWTRLLDEEERDTLIEKIADLSERERMVILMYYFEDTTLEAIGKRFGIHRTRVSQIHTIALRKLRVAMGAKA